MIDEMDEFAWTKTHGFSNYVLPKEGEKPFITTLDWYLSTGAASHAKDKVANILGNQLELAKKALRAVVELHKEEEKYDCDKCDECGFSYPCPTIQVIEKELN